MNFTPLERDILAWIAKRHPDLAEQIHSARVIRRKRAAAFFTYLTDYDGPADSQPIEGPHITSPLADAGGGSILWMHEGKPNVLEVWSYSDNFDEELPEYELVDKRTV